MSAADTAIIHEQLNRILANQTTQDARMQNMEKTLSDVTVAVSGNPTFGHKGLVKQVEELQAYVNGDRKLKNKILGGVAVLITIWGVAFEMWKKFF